jgi:hypothetical protein
VHFPSAEEKRKGPFCPNENLSPIWMENIPHIIPFDDFCKLKRMIFLFIN